MSNRLRSVLLRYYPAALQVFKGGLTTQIAAEFVLAYPTPQAAQALRYSAFERFACSHGYRRVQNLPGSFSRLQADYPPASPETVAVYQTEAQLLARLLLETMRAKLSQLAELQDLYRQHPNYATFNSLPGMGKLIGPGQLVKFGDDRQRFPHPSSAQALAGTCPVTKRSGKHKSVVFRRACDKEWRYFCQEWGMALVYRTQAPIARAYYETIRPHFTYSGPKKYFGIVTTSRLFPFLGIDKAVPKTTSAPRSYKSTGICPGFAQDFRDPVPLNL